MQTFSLFSMMDYLILLKLIFMVNKWEQQQISAHTEEYSKHETLAPTVSSWNLLLAN